MKPIVFVHIPKTSGTSVAELLARQFHQFEVLRLRDIHKPLIEISADIDVALAEGKKFIFGHFPYAALAPFRDQITALTMLRDPIDRIISAYHFWRRQDASAQPSDSASFAIGAATSLSFEDFINCEHPLLTSTTRNEMCRMLVPPTDRLDYASFDARLYEEALEALEGMAFGIVENFTASIELLSYQLSLSIGDEARLNVNKSRPTNEVALDREFILKHNLADYALYERAKSLMATRRKHVDMCRRYAEVKERALTPMASDGRRFRWDASAPLCGQGWHERDNLGGSTIVRFTRPNRSILYLPNVSKGKNAVLTAQFPYFFPAGLMGSDGPVSLSKALTFRINGSVVDVSTSPLGGNGASFILQLPASRLAEADWLELVIESPYGAVPSWFGSEDDRLLGVALELIEIEINEP